jgi:glucose/arabinose dehydrogenase
VLLALVFPLLTYAEMAQVIAVPDNLVAALHLPAGFAIKVFAKLDPAGSDYFRGPRFMAFSPAGDLYLSLGRDNKVVMLPDRNHDGVADHVVTVDDHLNAPQGLAFVAGKLYVANQDGLVALQQDGAQKIVSNLPDGGHTLKSLKLGPDGFLYLSVGSSCNVCDEQDPLRATILRYATDGKPAGALITYGRHAPTPIWATGLRNSQGFAWHPVTGEMYASNDGADMRSDRKGAAAKDELPPEHLNIIKAGENYGWPHCWGEHVSDPDFAAGNDSSADFCAKMQTPVITFPAHSTPIGLTFLNRSHFPAEYQNDMLVALHGSWNRQQPSGYKIVRVHFAQNHPVTVSDFVTGWLNASGAWGRPVDVAVGPDGAVYVSDDRAGMVYRIEYKGEAK